MSKRKLASHWLQYWDLLPNLYQWISLCCYLSIENIAHPEIQITPDDWDTNNWYDRRVHNCSAGTFGAIQGIGNQWNIFNGVFLHILERVTNQPQSVPGKKYWHVGACQYIWPETDWLVILHLRIPCCHNSVSNFAVASSIFRRRKHLNISRRNNSEIS